MTDERIKKTFFDELDELFRIYDKLYDLMIYESGAEQNVEITRALLYEVAELAGKFGFTVRFIWDDTRNYFRKLHGFTIQ